MPEVPAYGRPAPRGITPSDVERAADQLLRAGARPTIERIRAALGTGSPNTINPLLDDWWKRLAGRLDAGPAAFHRLPDAVAHLAEALWLQALDDGRRRALLELAAKDRAATRAQEDAVLGAHVLSLRERELDSRLADRDRRLADLERQNEELRLALRKAEATQASVSRQVAVLQADLDTAQQRQLRPKLARPARPSRIAMPRKAAVTKPRHKPKAKPPKRRPRRP